MTERTMPNDESPNTPGAFWRLYLREHQNSTNRWLHALGTWSSWIVVAIAVVTQNWWLLLLAPVVGYGMAWIGHLTIEKNKPLSMRHPVRSLLADFRLAALMLIGRDPGRQQMKSSSRREHA